MVKKEIMKKVKRFGALVRERIPVKYILLYGSHAQGKATAESDIDVAVVLEKEPERNFLEMDAELYTIRRSVDTRIEPVLLVERHDRSGFLREIKAYGQIID